MEGSPAQPLALRWTYAGTTVSPQTLQTIPAVVEIKETAEVIEEFFGTFYNLLTTLPPGAKYQPMREKAVNTYKLAFDFTAAFALSLNTIALLPDQAKSFLRTLQDTAEIQDSDEAMTASFVQQGFAIQTFQESLTAMQSLSTDALADAKNDLLEIATVTNVHEELQDLLKQTMQASKKVSELDEKLVTLNGKIAVAAANKKGYQEKVEQAKALQAATDKDYDNVKAGILASIKAKEEMVAAGPDKCQELGKTGRWIFEEGHLVTKLDYTKVNACLAAQKEFQGKLENVLKEKSSAMRELGKMIADSTGQAEGAKQEHKSYMQQKESVVKEMETEQLKLETLKSKVETISAALGTTNVELLAKAAGCLIDFTRSAARASIAQQNGHQALRIFGGGLASMLNIVLQAQTLGKQIKAMEILVGRFTADSADANTVTWIGKKASGWTGIPCLTGAAPAAALTDAAPAAALTDAAPAAALTDAAPAAAGGGAAGS